MTFRKNGNHRSECRANRRTVPGRCGGGVKCGETRHKTIINSHFIDNKNTRQQICRVVLGASDVRPTLVGTLSRAAEGGRESRPGFGCMGFFPCSTRGSAFGCGFGMGLGILGHARAQASCWSTGFHLLICLIVCESM